MGRRVYNYCVLYNISKRTQHENFTRKNTTYSVELSSHIVHAYLPYFRTTFKIFNESMENLRANNGEYVIVYVHRVITCKRVLLIIRLVVKYNSNKITRVNVFKYLFFHKFYDIVENNFFAFSVTKKKKKNKVKPIKIINFNN